MINQRIFRRIRRIALAGLALFALCACGSEPVITDKASLVEQCGLELDALRRLGLFTAEFDVTPEAEVPDFEYRGYGPCPELPEDRYEGVIPLRGFCEAEHKYSYTLYIDTDTGKITELNINAKPQQDWIPFLTGFWNEPGSRIMGFYDNCEALFDPEMTLGQMCSGWAQYQGYESWELFLDAAEDVRFIDAQELEAWNIGYSGTGGITAAFYRSGKKEPEYYAFNYTPAAAGPYYLILPAEGPYVPRDDIPASRDGEPAPAGERDAAALINGELDALRKLGLLRTELEVTRRECERGGITGGRIGEEYKGKTYMTSSCEREDCNYYLCYDAGTGKLDCVAVCPKPEDGSLSVPDVYSGFGAVMDEGLTIGKYCELWAQYQGYESWELPEGVDEDTRYLDAHRLDAWSGGISGGEGPAADGLTISFYRAGGGEPEYAYVKYGPSGIGPGVVFGSDYSDYIW